MKRRIISLLLALSLLLSTSAIAHPGRTDSSGGHNVRTGGWGYPVGSYHYHNGGPAYGGSSDSSSSYSEPVLKPSRVVIEAAKAYIFPSASTKSKAIGVKVKGDRLYYKGTKGSWYKVGFYDAKNKYKTGYVHKNNVSIEYE